MIPRKNKQSLVTNKLQSAAFAEKIFSKYSTARRDIWFRLSLVFRDDVAFSPGVSDSVRQFLININFILKQKEEGLSLYKRINSNKISRLINKNLRSTSHFNSYPAGSGERLPADGGAGYNSLTVYSTILRQWAAGGSGVLAGPPGRAGVNRTVSCLPVNLGSESAPDIMRSRIEAYPSWLNFSSPGATGWRDKIIRQTMTVKNAQAGKEYIAAGDFIINLLNSKGLKNFLSYSQHSIGSLTETATRSDHSVRASSIYHLRQPLNNTLYDVNPAPGLRLQGDRSMPPGSGRAIYRNEKILYMKDSRYFGYPSMVKRVLPIQAANIFRLVETALKLRQAAKTAHYAGDVNLNTLPIRGGSFPENYSNQGLVPGRGFVFEGWPWVSYDKDKNQQERSILAVRILSGMLGRVFGMPVERIMQVQQAAKTRGSDRETGLNVLLSRTGGLPAEHVFRGLDAGMSLGYDGSPWGRLAPGLEFQQVRSIPAVRNFILSGMLSRAFGLQVERIIRVQQAAIMRGSDRKSGMNVLLRQPGGPPASYNIPRRLDAGKSLGIDGSPWGSPVPGFEFQQARSISAVRNFILSGKPGRAFDMPVKRIIQMQQALKTRGGETGSNVLLRHPGGLPEAYISRGLDTGMSLGYDGSPWGSPVPGFKFQQARSISAVRNFILSGKPGRAFDMPVKRIIQMQQALKTRGGGRETGSNVLLRHPGGLPEAYISRGLDTGMSLGYDGSPWGRPVPGHEFQRVRSATSARGLKTFGIIERSFSRPVEIIIKLLRAIKAGGSDRETGLYALLGRSAGQPAELTYPEPVPGTSSIYAGSPWGRPGPGFEFQQVLLKPAGRDIRVSLKLIRAFDWPSEKIIKNINLHYPGSGRSGLFKTVSDGPVAAAGRFTAALAFLFKRYFIAGTAGQKAAQPQIYHRTTVAVGPDVLRSIAPGTGATEYTGDFSLQLLREKAIRQGGPADYYGKARKTRGQSNIPQFARAGMVGNRAPEPIVVPLPDRIINSPATALTFFRQDKVPWLDGHANVLREAPEAKGQIEVIGKFEKVLMKIIDRVRNMALDRLVRGLPDGIINTLNNRVTRPLTGKTNRSTVTGGKSLGNTAGHGHLGKKTGISREKRPEKYFFTEKIFLKALPGRLFHSERGRRGSPMTRQNTPGGNKYFSATRHSVNSFIASQYRTNAMVYFLRAALTEGRERLTGYRAGGVSLPVEGSAVYSKAGLEYIYSVGTATAIAGDFKDAASGPEGRQIYRRPGEMYSFAGTAVRNIAATAGHSFINKRRNINVTKVFNLEDRYMVDVFRKAQGVITGTGADAGQAPGRVETGRSYALMPSMEYRKQITAEDDRAMGGRSAAPGASAQRTLNIENTMAPIGHTPKIDINKIADKVFREIERRFKWERQRRGI